MLRTDYISLTDVEKLQLLEFYYVDQFRHLEQVLAQADQLIVGRRGTGKTTLFYRAFVECMVSWAPSSPPSGLGKRTLEGEVLESQPPKRLVLTWADTEDPTDGSKLTFDIEPVADMVRLNVLHGDFNADSVMAGKVSQGWSLVLSSLKSHLETGNAIDIWPAKATCKQS